MKKLVIIEKKTDELIPYINNARTHNDEQVTQIASSIKEFGFNNPVLLDGENGIIAGHGRLLAAKKLGLEKVPCIELSHLSEVQKKAYILADNKIALNSGWDLDLLAAEISELKEADIDLDLIGFSEEELEKLSKDISSESVVKQDEEHGKLTDTFIVPPFSVLDTRQEYWQERKRYWRQMIGDTGESRENVLSNSELIKSINSATSLFDPVLAECLCLWFTPGNKSSIFDCFAGDTQKGFIFARKGHFFKGIELRQEQVDVNNKVIEENDLKNISYICDDGRNVKKYFEPNSQDLLFSCPPYYNLEIYSDKPNDASNQKTYSDFISILRDAYSSALDCLKENRFAVIVVGDVRDSKGFYYDFCSDIKKIFKDNGVKLYNELILIEPIGTLPQRVGKYMEVRKIGKCHQNVMVFYKGNPKNIKENYPNLKINIDKIIEGNS